MQRTSLLKNARSTSATLAALRGERGCFKSESVRPRRDYETAAADDPFVATQLLCPKDGHCSTTTLKVIYKKPDRDQRLIQGIARSLVAMRRAALKTIDAASPDDTGESVALCILISHSCGDAVAETMKGKLVSAVRIAISDHAGTQPAHSLNESVTE